MRTENAHFSRRNAPEYHRIVKRRTTRARSSFTGSLLDAAVDSGCRAGHTGRRGGGRCLFAPCSSARRTNGVLPRRIFRRANLFVEVRSMYSGLNTVSDTQHSTNECQAPLVANTNPFRLVHSPHTADCAENTLGCPCACVSLPIYSMEFTTHTFSSKSYGLNKSMLHRAGFNKATRQPAVRVPPERFICPLSKINARSG